ncbi:ATP12 family chaperone protein [Neogemmobacter tilapiae]|uniref:ATPase n=1 Tax=Neogemmobacter tilapiae TaxID=875041 RepID=A0A918TNW2_9RHOB|nr:ATP12 family protein [Gemmobacter tilapiae]GHC56811.1 ATPase [Gemmobacter tilapiae]
MAAGWTAKRFWKETGVAVVDDGYAVVLDGRGVKTPAKRALVLPTGALAQAVAEEWEAQQGQIRPDTMPLTRTANSALDKVAPQFAEVANLLAAYGGHDLLCYRATGPAALAARQAELWNPMLEWAAAQFAAPLLVTQGVVPVDQPPASVQALADQVHRLNAFELAAFHDLVAITGSLVLALAFTHDRLTLEQLWAIARVDEDWQATQWGQDDEAVEVARLKQSALESAGRFWALCRSQSA